MKLLGAPAAAGAGTLAAPPERSRSVAPALAVRRRGMAWQPLVPALLFVAAVAIGTLTIVGLPRLPQSISTPVLLVLLAPVGLVAAAVVVWRQELGLALVPFVAAAIPLSVGTGTQSPIVAGLMLAAGLVLLGLLRVLRARDLRPGAGVWIPAVGVALVWFVSYVWSNVELAPLVTVWPTFWLVQLGALGVLVCSVGVLLHALHSTLRDTRWVAVATWTFLPLGAIAVLAYFAGDQRATEFLDSRGLFSMWIVALALGQALFNHRLPWYARAGLVVLGLANVVKAAVLQTSWKSGWLPSVPVLAVLVFFRSKRWFVGLGLLALVAGAEGFDDLYAAIIGSEINEGSNTRGDIWAQAFDLVSRHLVLGTGPAGYAVYFQSEYAGSSFSMSTHSNYVDTLAQTGIVGLLALVWLLAALGWAGWKARSAYRTGFLGGYAQGAFAGYFGLLVAMGLGDWFIPFAYNQTIAGFRYTVQSWVFLGLLAGLAARAQAGLDREERGLAGSLRSR